MKIYFFCLFLLMMSTYNYAQPRFLDSTFGNNGKVVTDLGSEEEINSIAFQSNGKIVAGGYYDLIKKNLAFDWVVRTLARYKANGQLDSSFGKNGFIYYDSVFSDLDAITVQKDDKIAGVGYAYPIDQGPAQLIILRAKKNGALDSSFGGKGIVYFGDLITNFFGKAIALQDDNKFVVAGANNTINDGDSSFVLVARFNSNGTLDSGFGNNGSKKITFGFRAFATGVVINSKGEIIIAAYNTPKTNNNFSQPFVINLTASGMLNKNFGVKGIATIQLKDDASFASLTLTKDEKIIAGGSIGTEGNRNFFLAGFNQTGIIDSAFGSNGIVNSDLGYDEQITSIAIQANEKVVAAGYSFKSDSNETYFALARYSSTGIVDKTFGTQGRIFTAFSGHNNYLSKILLQKDGKIVAGGSSDIRRYGYGDFALSRYLNNDVNNQPQIPIARKSKDENFNAVSSILSTR